MIGVIGIGRTLSSALCEAMQLLGVNFGARQIRGEHLLLVEYLERLHPFPSIADDHPPCPRDVAADLQHVFRQIRLECGAWPMGIKYPSLCWHLPELAKAAPDLVWIHIDRQLEDSINSLVNRSTPLRSPSRLQASPEQCRRFQISLWEAKEDWFHGPGAPDHLHIWAEHLMADPKRELERLIDHAGLKVTPEQMERAAAHIDPARAPHSRAISA